MEILEGGKGLLGPRSGYDEAGAISRSPGQHLKKPLPDHDALHLGVLHSNAEALRLSNPGFQKSRARDKRKAEVVLDVFRVTGPPPGSVEQYNAEVVAAEVDAGLQAPRPRPDDDAVKECLAACAFRLFHSPPPLSQCC